MHELPVMKSILDIVLTHAQKHDVQKVRAVHLEVGELCDLEPEWMQRYFDYVSRGTIAASAELKILRMPVTLQCSSCGNVAQVDKMKFSDAACAVCGNKQMNLISGREYYIKNMEVE